VDSAPTRRFSVALHRLLGCYFARVKELPGCVCRGATEVEAIENARAAIGTYLWIVHALAGDEARIELEISAAERGPDNPNAA
jgi:predicted RNase H-like HicB family nuclease